jgi:hypothetical protein
VDNKKISYNDAKIISIFEKAENDPIYKNELLKHPKETLAKEGIHLEKKTISCYENTAQDFYIIVPIKALEENQKLSTLSKNASLEQIMRFIITQVQLNTPLKQKLIDNANIALKEQGVKIPQDLKIHVYQSTHERGYLVLPRIPDEDVELNDFELQAFAGGVSHYDNSGAPDITRRDRIDAHSYGSSSSIQDIA